MKAQKMIGKDAIHAISVSPLRAISYLVLELEDLQTLEFLLIG